jgi:hypothetical protein
VKGVQRTRQKYVERVYKNVLIGSPLKTGNELTVARSIPHVAYLRLPDAVNSVYDLGSGVFFVEEVIVILITLRNAWHSFESN